MENKKDVIEIVFFSFVDITEEVKEAIIKDFKRRTRDAISLGKMVCYFLNCRMANKEGEIYDNICKSVAIRSGLTKLNDKYEVSYSFEDESWKMYVTVFIQHYD